MNSSTGKKSELCRLSSVTHRGQSGSHCFSNLDAAHAGYTIVSPGLTVERRIMPEEQRWCPGISRCFAARCVPVVKKTTGPLPDNRRLHTGYLDSMRYFPVWSRFGPVFTHGRFIPGQCELGLNYASVISSYFTLSYIIHVSP